MSDLITIADLETYSKSTIDDGNTSVTTADEALYSFLISAVSAQVERMCNRSFASAEYTEVVDGNGQTDILLSNYPIISLTSITLVNPFDDNGVDWGTDNVKIDYEAGTLYSPYGWPVGRFNISVTYTAGYATIPDDLKAVVCQMVLDAYSNTSKRTGITSERMGDYAYTIASDVAKKEEYKAKLSQFIRYD